MINSKSSLETLIKRWKNEGSHPFLVKSIYKSREVFRSVMRKLLNNSIIDKIASLGPVNNLDDLFSMASRGWYGIISPIQSRMEFTSLLAEISRQQPSTVLEIGTASGGTLFMYSRVASADATIVSVDLPGGSFGGGYPESRIKLYEAFALPNQNLHLIRADSHLQETFDLVEECFENQTIDFIFIDGDHTYEGVRSDFEMYSKLVSKNGYIAFHDTIYAQGVKKFWLEIKDQYEFTQEWIDKDNPRYGIGLIKITEKASV